MVKNPILNKNGLLAGTCRIGLRLKGRNDSFERGYQLAGGPFLYKITNFNPKYTKQFVILLHFFSY
jgi:hypothetical protein